MAKMRKRPEYHFTAQKGWINDPNGLYFQDGYFHILYQYNKSDTSWGMTAIGHAITSDFLHYEEVGEILLPSEEYEKDPRGGCFSGSIIKKDNVWYFVYTGSVIQNEGLKQTQNIAVSKDGYTFTRFSGNPVIKEPIEGADPNFRDPKVFVLDGCYYMAVGCKIGPLGAVFLYSSSDMFSWSYQGVLYKGNEEDGTLFECPDFYEIYGGKWVLTFSPENNRYGIRSFAVTGSFDKKSLIFTPQCKKCLDYGLDFYARQSYLIGTRRIALSWLNQWPWMSTFQGHGEAADEGWCGCLSMPREEKIIKGRLISFPVDEIISHFERVESGEIEITSKENFIITPSSYSFRLSVVIDRKESHSGEVVIVAGSFTFRINYERNFITALPAGKNSSFIPLKGDGDVVLDFFFDNSVLELFVDNGESSASWIFTPEVECPRICIGVNQKDAFLKYSLFYLKKEEK